MVVGVAHYNKKGDYNMFTIWVHMQIANNDCLWNNGYNWKKLMIVLKIELFLEMCYTLYKAHRFAESEQKMASI